MTRRRRLQAVASHLRPNVNAGETQQQRTDTAQELTGLGEQRHLLQREAGRLKDRQGPLPLAEINQPGGIAASHTRGQIARQRVDSTAPQSTQWWGCDNTDGSCRASHCMRAIADVTSSGLPVTS